MRTRQRAIDDQDKASRRQAILDAAERLYLEHPDRMAAIAEVAERAGVAKGTVYLYFPSKEEMLLALHERHVTDFFTPLMRRLASHERADFDAVFAITREHILRRPGYLELTSRCFAMMDRGIPVATAAAFKARIAQTLSAAGGQLERHFPIAAGSGVALLMHSYALMVGLWQLVHPNERLGDLMSSPELRPLALDYEREAEAALRALWAGAGATPPIPRSTP